MADRMVFFKDSLVALAGIDGADRGDTNPLQALDAAFVGTGGTGGTFYSYLLDESGDAESSPDIIKPLTNAGDFRWKLQSPAIVIADASITNAKLAHIATSTIKGRVAAGSGDVEDLTATNVRTIINVADGANAYVHPNHSGDVTSVADGATTIAAKAVHVSMLADGTDGELITWDSDGVAAVVAAGTATHVLTSNGAGAAPTFAVLPTKLANVVEDTTPQLGGFLDMNKKYISLTTGLSDAEFCGITCEGTGGATAIAFGTLCYFKASDSLWYPAKADVTATSGIVKLGMCVLAGTSAATRMLLYGNIRANSLFPSFSPLSGKVYVSAATAGEVTSTAPTGTTNFVVRSIGRANTADELFFNPSEDYVELA